MTKTKNFSLHGTPCKFYVYSYQRKGFDASSGWIDGRLDLYHMLSGKKKSVDFDKECEKIFERSETA